MQEGLTGPGEALNKAAERLQAVRETSLACSKNVPGGEGRGGGDGLPQGHNDRVQGVVGRYLVAGAEEVCPARFPLSSFFVFPLSLLLLLFLLFMMVRQEEDQEHPIGVHCHIAHHHRG